MTIKKQCDDVKGVGYEIPAYHLNLQVPLASLSFSLYSFNLLFSCQASYCFTLRALLWPQQAAIFSGKALKAHHTLPAQHQMADGSGTFPSIVKKEEQGSIFREFCTADFPCQDLITFQEKWSHSSSRHIKCVSDSSRSQKTLLLSHTC